MTTNYQTLVDYAWMSQASYLDLTGFNAATSIETLRVRLRNDTYNEGNQFAEKQAESFTDLTDGYRVQHQQANDGNGFQNVGVKSCNQAFPQNAIPRDVKYKARSFNCSVQNCTLRFRFAATRLMALGQLLSLAV